MIDDMKNLSDELRQRDSTTEDVLVRMAGLVTSLFQVLYFPRQLGNALSVLCRKQIVFWFVAEKKIYRLLLCVHHGLSAA